MLLHEQVCSSIGVEIFFLSTAGPYIGLLASMCPRLCHVRSGPHVSASCPAAARSTALAGDCLPVEPDDKRDRQCEADGPFDISELVMDVRFGGQPAVLRFALSQFRGLPPGAGFAWTGFSTGVAVAGLCSTGAA
jgi:hypothetical protein